MLPSAKSAAIQRLARAIAAEKMGLRDLTGKNLPSDLWMQCIPEAEREFDMHVEDRSIVDGD